MPFDPAPINAEIGNLKPGGARFIAFTGSPDQRKRLEQEMYRSCARFDGKFIISQATRGAQTGVEVRRTL